MVLGRGHDGVIKWPPFRALADELDLHPVGKPLEILVVLENLAVLDQNAGITNLNAEILRRRRYPHLATRGQTSDEGDSSEGSYDSNDP